MSKMQKKARKYRILRGIAATFTVIFAILILGTVGGLENDMLTWGKFFLYLALTTIGTGISFYAFAFCHCNYNHACLIIENKKQARYITNEAE